MLEMLQSFKRDASYAFSSVGGTIVTKIPQGELMKLIISLRSQKMVLRVRVILYNMLKLVEEIYPQSSSLRKKLLQKKCMKNLEI